MISHLRVTKIADVFDCTTKSFPGAPVLLASQKYSAVSESSSLLNTRVLFRMPEMGVKENVSSVNMISVSPSGSPFLYQTIVGTGNPVAAQVMLMVPPRKCSTPSEGSSIILEGTETEQAASDTHKECRYSRKEEKERAKKKRESTWN